MASYEVPVIDLERLADGNQQAQDAVVRQLGDSRRNFGFAQAVNHGISSDWIAKPLVHSREFFALTNSMKNRVATHAFNQDNANRYRGYFPATPGEAWKEGFEFGREKPATAEVSQNFLQVRSVWPDSVMLPDD